MILILSISGAVIAVAALLAWDYRRLCKRCQRSAENHLGKRKL